MTATAIEKAAQKHPGTVCEQCGIRYGNRPDLNRDGTTWHDGSCGVCGEETAVTETRDFGGLKECWRHHTSIGAATQPPNFGL